MNIDLLKRLSETPGVPGREERVRELLIKELKGLADEVTTDPVEITTSMLPVFAARSSWMVPIDSVKKPRCFDMFMCRISNIGVVCVPSMT